MKQKKSMRKLLYEFDYYTSPGIVLIMTLFVVVVIFLFFVLVVYRRNIFNWAHRIVGTVALIMAGKANI